MKADAEEGGTAVGENEHHPLFLAGAGPFRCRSAPKPRWRTDRPLSSVSPHHSRFGLETFIFNGPPPTAGRRFSQVCCARACLASFAQRGFYGTEPRSPERVGFVSIAGDTLRADYLGPWWFLLPSWPGTGLGGTFTRDPWRKAWLPELGDRRQEIVFIGVSTSIAMNLPKPLVPVLSPSEPNFALTVALATSEEPPEVGASLNFGAAAPFVR